MVDSSYGAVAGGALSRDGSECGMFDKIVESKIREAMANGEFDDLAGKGKPLDLSDYFATPEHLRVGYSLLKQHGFIPEEVVVLKEIDALRGEIGACADGERRARLATELNAKLLKLEVLKEHSRRARPR